MLVPPITCVLEAIATRASIAVLRPSWGWLNPVSLRKARRGSERVHWWPNGMKSIGVPAEYASQRLTLKSYPDRLCIYHHNRLVARHLRRYQRHRDFEHHNHPRALLEQRRKASTQRLLQRFVSLTTRADEYYRELEQRRLNPIHHVRKIVALSEVYGTEAAARALDDLRVRCVAEVGAVRTRLTASRDCPQTVTGPGRCRPCRKFSFTSSEIGAEDSRSCRGATRRRRSLRRCVRGSRPPGETHMQSAAPTGGTSPQARAPGRPFRQVVS